MFWLFFAIMINNSNGIIYKLNETEYIRMPPLYHMDAYESCMEDNDGFYCTVDFTLVSDTPTPLLTMIQEYSKHTTKHFNHSKLRYSVCVNKYCYNYWKVNQTDLTRYLEACLNETISKNYGLKINVNGNPYCHKSNEKVTVNTSDIVVAIVCSMFLIANLIGSFIGIFFTQHIRGLNTIPCFSIQRSWRRLIAPSDNVTDFRFKRLKCLNGLKSITTMCAIGAHSLLLHVLNTKNPLLFEQSYDYLFSHIAYNGTIITQLYFIMSGFLLIYSMQVIAEKIDITWKFVPKTILLRWLRLTPAYALVLAVSSTLLRHVKQGPLWQHVINSEVESCKREWIWNMLYINNYLKNAHCMGQSWYMAADMQLSCLGVIMFVVFRRKYHRNLALGILFLIGLITPGLHTYIQDLDGAMLGTPETLRTLFVWYPTFDSVYKPGHTNIAGYTLGLALGFFIYHKQIENSNIQLKKLRFVVWSAIPIAISLMMSNSVFYADMPRSSIYVRTLYASISKPLFGLLMVFFIVGMIFRSEDFCRKLFEWHLWRISARLSYSALLLHIMLVRIYTGTITTTLQATYIKIILNCSSFVIVSYLAAIPLYLIVEAPILNLMKLNLGLKSDVVKGNKEN